MRALFVAALLTARAAVVTMLTTRPHSLICSTKIRTPPFAFW